MRHTDSATDTDDAGEASPGRQAPGRLAGLDLARGVVVLVVVVHGAWLNAPTWWQHATWEGVHGSDLVFPTFVTLSGCALALGLRRRPGVTSLLRRTLVLLLAGLAYNAHHQLVVDGAVTWAGLRWTGVLQVFAVLGLAGALLHVPLGRRPWAWVAAAAAGAVAHTWALRAFARACPGEVLTPECNPSGAYDVLILGARHVYAHGARGHDPEGLVAAAGALVSAAAGIALGHTLLAYRDRPGSARLRLLALGVAFAVLATTTAAFVPPMKRLWTAPFALGIAALAAAGLALAHAILDRPAPGRLVRGASWPLVALGRNSLLVYVGSMALATTLVAARAAGSDTSRAQGLADAVAFGGTGDLGIVLLAVVAWTAFAGVLHRLGVHVRA